MLLVIILDIITAVNISRCQVLTVPTGGDFLAFPL